MQAVEHAAFRSVHRHRPKAALVVRHVWCQRHLETERRVRLGVVVDHVDRLLDLWRRACIVSHHMIAVDGERERQVNWGVKSVSVRLVVVRAIREGGDCLTHRSLRAGNQFVS